MDVVKFGVGAAMLKFLGEIEQSLGLSVSLTLAEPSRRFLPWVDIYISALWPLSQCVLERFRATILCIYLMHQKIQKEFPVTNGMSVP